MQKTPGTKTKPVWVVTALNWVVTQPVQVITHNPVAVLVIFLAVAFLYFKAIPNTEAPLTPQHQPTVVLAPAPQIIQIGSAGIETMDLQPIVRTIPSLLGRQPIESVKNTIDDRRSHLIQAFLFGEGPERESEIADDIHWLTQAAREGYSVVAEPALADAITAIDVSARANLSRGRTGWVALSIWSIEQADDFTFASAPYSGMTATQIAEKLRGDWAVAVEEEGRRVADEAARQTALLIQQKEALQTQATSQAASATAQASQASDQKQRAGADTITDPSAQAVPLSGAASSGNPPEAGEVAAKPPTLAELPGEYQPIIEAVPNPPGIGWSMIPIMWNARHIMEAIKGMPPEMWQTTTHWWVVDIRPCSMMFDLLPHSCVFFGESQDTLPPPAWEEEKTYFQWSGKDPVGKYFWLTDLILVSPNLKVGQNIKTTDMAGTILHLAGIK